jgi:biopolymer transport protein ExbD
MRRFEKAYAIGVPFNQLKGFLALDEEGQKKVKQPGIPVKDSATNELYYWVRDAWSAFAGKRVNCMIKGDNAAKYPDFKRVLEAFKRNDIYKFQLVTAPEAAPVGTELYKTRQSGGKPAAK